MKEHMRQKMKKKEKKNHIKERKDQLNECGEVIDGNSLVPFVGYLMPTLEQN